MPKPVPRAHRSSSTRREARCRPTALPQKAGPCRTRFSSRVTPISPSTTTNGGVSISGVQSSIEFHAVNGGISLKDVGGNVRGDTVNGGVSVNLANATWTGQGLDVTTNNGGVTMKGP